MAGEKTSDLMLAAVAASNRARELVARSRRNLHHRASREPLRVPMILDAERAQWVRVGDPGEL